MLRPLSDKEIAEQRRAIRRYLRRYALALIAFTFWALWQAGYYTGFIDGNRAAARSPETTQRNDK